jgi:hypothetical protein
MAWRRRYLPGDPPRSTPTRADPANTARATFHHPLKGPAGERRFFHSSLFSCYDGLDEGLYVFVGQTHHPAPPRYIAGHAVSFTATCSTSSPSLWAITVVWRTGAGRLQPGVLRPLSPAHRGHLGLIPGAARVVARLHHECSPDTPLEDPHSCRERGHSFGILAASSPHKRHWRPRQEQAEVITRHADPRDLRPNLTATPAGWPCAHRHHAHRHAPAAISGRYCPDGVHSPG